MKPHSTNTTLWNTITFGIPISFLPISAPLRCDYFMDTVNLTKLPDIDSTTTSLVRKEYLLNAVLSNVYIIDKSSNLS